MRKMDPQKKNLGWTQVLAKGKRSCFL